MAFLDSTGLSHLWNKITAYVDEKVSSSGGTNTGGSGGVVSQKQADYTQNDSTKVDFIKNRPFYTEDKYTHNVILGDENIDYSMYKIGDIVPSRDFVYEFALRISEVVDGETLTAVLTNISVGVIPMAEGIIDVALLLDVENMLFSSVSLVHQEFEGIPTGIYLDVSEFIECNSVEVDVICHKKVESKYIPNAPDTIVVDANGTYDIGSVIPVPPTDMYKLTTSVYSMNEIRLFLRASIDSYETIYLPVRNLGVGIYEVTSLIVNLILQLNMEYGGLEVITGAPLVPNTETEQATTYGLRKPSLADMINASLEERGLAPSQIKEKFPKADFTKFISNE